MLAGGHKLEAYLPGKKCTGTVDPGISLECHDSDDPWPLGGSGQQERAFFGARNFFTGALAGVKGPRDAQPFFSAAVAPGDNPVVLLAATDGSLRDLQQRTYATPTGSDIAGVKSGCGAGWQVLVTRASDQTETDSMRAEEINGSALRPVSAALEFPGPITALWTSSEGNAAQATIRNLKSGRYEAYLISIDCR
jgi:hypothetical protein